MINIQDEMSILYNDQRVLENHHLAKAWELLLKPENNFLKNFDKKEFLKIRKLIIELVLATDLSQHNQLLSSFKDKVNKYNSIKNTIIYLLLFQKFEIIFHIINLKNILF